MTQKKAAGKPATKKTAAQDPAIDPINNVSTLDQDLSNEGEEGDEEDDFDASEGGSDSAKAEQTPQQPEASKAKDGTQKKAAGKTEPGNFEQWDVDIKGKGQYEKLRKLRDNVKISEFEAETLNQGALGQLPGTRHVLYLKPE